MKEQKICNIVQDLLPNYIENLTNEETNKFIDEHLKECCECKQTLESLQKDLKVDDTVRDKKTVKYFKKYKSKLRTLRIILLIIIVAFVGNTVRKMVIISQMSNKAEMYVNSENYHIMHYIYNKDKTIISEQFVLGDKIKSTTIELTPKKRDIVTYYAKKYGIDERGNDMCKTNIYTETENKKIAELNTNHGISGGSPMNWLETYDFLHLILASIHSSIKTTTYEGKECYYISSNPKKCYFFENNMHIDKDTGLVINAGACEVLYVDGHLDRAPATDYIYEFNTVTEDDFIEPDINEYELKQ